MAHNTVKPSDRLAAKDLQFGIPTLILNCEMVFFSVLFMYAYRVSPYVISRYSPQGEAAKLGQGPNGGGNPTQYCGGFLGWRAIFAAVNILDFLEALVMAPIRMRRGLQRGG